MAWEEISEHQIWKIFSGADPPYNLCAYARFQPGQYLALPLHSSLLRAW